MTAAARRRLSSLFGWLLQGAGRRRLGAQAARSGEPRSNRSRRSSGRGAAPEITVSLPRGRPVSPGPRRISSSRSPPAGFPLAFEITWAFRSPSGWGSPAARPTASGSGAFKGPLPGGDPWLTRRRPLRAAWRALPGVTRGPRVRPGPRVHAAAPHLPRLPARSLARPLRRALRGAGGRDRSSSRCSFRPPPPPGPRASCARSRPRRGSPSSPMIRNSRSSPRRRSSTPSSRSRVRMGARARR